MKPFERLAGTAAGAQSPLPTTCPSCKSSSIATAAKTPDANSYWRCDACGEIWNNARDGSRRSRGSSWRA